MSGFDEAVNGLQVGGQKKIDTIGEADFKEFDSVKNRVRQIVVIPSSFARRVQYVGKPVIAAPPGKIVGEFDARNP